MKTKTPSSLFVAASFPDNVASDRLGGGLNNEINHGIDDSRIAPSAL